MHLQACSEVQLLSGALAEDLMSKPSVLMPLLAAIGSRDNVCSYVNAVFAVQFEGQIGNMVEMCSTRNESDF